MIGSNRSVLMVKPASSLPTPVASYGFSEGSGATAADSSGNGHTLAVVNPTWTTGHTGSGLTNSSATTGATTALVAPTTAITLIAWVKPLDLASGTTHFALGFIDNGGNTDVAIFTQRADFSTADVLQCDIRIGGSLLAFNGSALTVGTWVHVALTYDGAGNVKLYQNGSVVASSSSASGTISPGDGFYVAGWNAVSPYDTDIVVDDVRVFNIALTSTQVTTAMNTPVA